MLNYENKTEQIELRPASNEEAGLFYARPSAQDDAPRSNQYALTGHDDGRNVKWAVFQENG